MTTSPPDTAQDFDTLAASLARECGLTDLRLHYSRSSASSSRRWEIHAGWSPTRGAYTSARSASPMDCLEDIARQAEEADRRAVVPK